MGHRTITLTDRPPVRIDEDRWPTVAEANDSDDHAHPFQANRRWTLKVRQERPAGMGDDEWKKLPANATRTVVYGVYSTDFQSESDRRGGRLLDDGDDIPAAVKEVAEYLEFDPRLADECIADLPAEEL